MNTFDKRTLRKITSTLESLSSSTYISVRVPFGPQVDTWGRNGSRPRWAVRDKAPTVDGLDGYFVFDNGKYSAVVSSYFVNLYDIEAVYAPMPTQSILPLFRGVGEVFLAPTPEGVRRMFFPGVAVAHVWATSPYVELLKVG